MATRKASAVPTPVRDEPVLERFYNVRAAAVRLGLADPKDPKDTTGHSWLRDGFNRPLDGSKGRPFPGQYMSRQLVFSESDLATIVQIAREETAARLRAKELPPVSAGRPRRTRAAKTPALAGV